MLAVHILKLTDAGALRPNSYNPIKQAAVYKTNIFHGINLQKSCLQERSQANRIMLHNLTRVHSDPDWRKYYMQVHLWLEQGDSNL